MFESLLTPLFSSLFSPLIAAAQRIFITVNGVDEYLSFQNGAFKVPGHTKKEKEKRIIQEKKRAASRKKNKKR